MRNRVIALFGWLALIASGSALAQIQVMATMGLIADLVTNVGGNRVKVTQIVPGGADPHSFEPKPSVVRAISQAEVLFANGLNFEPFLPKLVAQLPQNARVVELADGMPNLIKNKDPGQLQYNPHLWLDPTYGIGYVEKVRDTLSELDSAAKASYFANASKYIIKIKAADATVQACLRSIPLEQRKLVSQHQALPYFLRYYKITSIGTIADFAGQQRGPQSLVNLAKAMKAQGVKVIFAEPQFSSAEAKVLAEATGSRVRRIYSDAFDERVSTYLDLIRANGKAVCESFNSK